MIIEVRIRHNRQNIRKRYKNVRIELVYDRIDNRIVERIERQIDNKAQQNWNDYVIEIRNKMELIEE